MNALSSAMLLAQSGGPAVAGESVLSIDTSALGWTFSSLGPIYSLVLPLSGFVVLIGACLVVTMSRRPAVIAAYLVFVPLPFLIGIFGSIHGLISSYQFIATSTASPPNPAEVAMHVSTGLVSSLVGLMVTFPSYFVVSIGLFLRTLFWQHKE